jgi:cytosine deaminase
MLEVASMGVHACQMSGEHELGLMFDAVTGNGARTLGLERYGLDVGCAGDLVLLDAFSVTEALRTRPARLAVVRGGEVVARATAPERIVLGAGMEGPVHFVQPPFQ